MSADTEFFSTYFFSVILRIIWSCILFISIPIAAGRVCGVHSSFIFLVKTSVLWLARRLLDSTYVVCSSLVPALLCIHKSRLFTLFQNTDSVNARQQIDRTSTHGSCLTHITSYFKYIFCLLPKLNKQTTNRTESFPIWDWVAKIDSMGIGNCKSFIGVWPLFGEPDSRKLFAFDMRYCIHSILYSGHRSPFAVEWRCHDSKSVFNKTATAVHVQQWQEFAVHKNRVVCRLVPVNGQSESTTERGSRAVTGQLSASIRLEETIKCWRKKKTINKIQTFFVLPQTTKRNYTHRCSARIHQMVSFGRDGIVGKLRTPKIN